MEQSKPESKKSRRRFLADILFIGGGISAAAILTKTKIFEGGIGGDSPVVMGALQAPELSPPGDASPACPIEPNEDPPAPLGEPMPPRFSPTPNPQTDPPVLPEGKPMAPKPEGEVHLP